MPLKLFELFFDDVVINFIVKITNFYTQWDKDKVNFTTTPSEIKFYFAMLILSGNNALPHCKTYVTKSRNCFVQIASNLHLADNLKLRKGNRMIEVRHLYDMLNAQCCKSSPNRYNKSVDESMLPYFGRHAKHTR